jgi:hypothetical protein
MDVIRHEYFGVVRPYRDSDLEIPVYWYFTQPCARQMPYINAFSDNRNSWNHPYHPPLGMQEDFKPANLGNFRNTLGQWPKGTRDAWQNGVDLPTPGQGCCCCGIIPIQEAPAGAVDGTNRIFTLSKLPLNAASVLLFNGTVLTQGVDYSVTGLNIFFAAPSTPTLGSNLLAQYWVAT